MPQTALGNGHLRCRRCAVLQQRMEHNLVRLRKFAHLAMPRNSSKFYRMGRQIGISTWGTGRQVQRRPTCAATAAWSRRRTAHTDIAQPAVDTWRCGAKRAATAAAYAHAPAAPGGSCWALHPLRGYAFACLLPPLQEKHLAVSNAVQQPAFGRLSRLCVIHVLRSCLLRSARHGWPKSRRGCWP